MSVLVVGTLAFDSVQTPAGTRTDVLGGSGSFLSTSAAYFAPVQLAGVVGNDFPEAHFDFFKQRSVDVANVHRADGPTFRWHGHYTPDMNTAQTLKTDLNVLRSFDPVLDARARDARYIVLGNFDPRLQRQVLQQVQRPAFVACDTMNYWIERHNAALRQTLVDVDLLCVNEAEARQLSGRHRLVEAAEAIFAMGPDHVVIKRGEHGALLISAAAEAGAANHAERAYAVPAYPFSQVRDPTGAGDTFAGSLMGYLAARDDTGPQALRHAVAMGTVMASFTVEDFSLDRLRDLSPAELQRRIDQIYRLTALDPGWLQMAPTPAYSARA